MADQAAKKKNGCLVGCLTVVVIFVVVMAIVVVYFMVNSKSIINEVMDQARDGMQTMLTEDHTEVERQQFVTTFNKLVEDLKGENIVESVQQNQDIIYALQDIIADRMITPEESQEWIKQYSQQVANTAKEAQE